MIVRAVIHNDDDEFHQLSITFRFSIAGGSLDLLVSLCAKPAKGVDTCGYCTGQQQVISL